jgi:hypothetical protein
MVNLFTTFYNEKDLVRGIELLDCLTLNIDCKVINKIHIWLENMEDISIKSDKIIIIPAASRPRYNDFFNVINKVSNSNDINIIANTDIFFKDDFEIIKHLDLENKCFTLTRWDIKEDFEAEFLGRVDSQDVWIFKGKIKDIDGNFYLGSLGCDNKIAYEIQKAGYNISNPSLTVRSYHLHLSQYRPGLSAYTAAPLAGPYLYVPITTHEGTLKRFINKISGKSNVNKKNNNYLMHRLYEGWLKDLLVENNKNLIRQMNLLLKCFYYRPAFNKKYIRHYVHKLVKPTIKNWLN